MIDIKANKRVYLSLLREVLPDADFYTIEAYLDNTDFFTAPASTRFHLSETGGLCAHSLNVYFAAVSLNHVFCIKNEHSIILCSLLHDICKADVYSQEYKNVKVYDEEVLANADKRKIKKDSKGEYIWDQKLQYVFDDRWPFGHGSKSAYIASSLIDLTPEEAMAIRYHMGAFEDGDKNNCSKVYETNKLALLIHFADMYASKIMEGEQNEN